MSPSAFAIFTLISNLNRIDRSSGRSLGLAPLRIRGGGTRADHPRATLSIGNAQAAKPLGTRFEEIWAIGQPGLTATVLGL